MPASPTADRRANRTALARDVRRIAEEIEGLYIQLEQAGALATIRQFMVRHQEGVPNFDMLQASKALRCYAGALSLMTTAAAKPKAASSPGPALGDPH
jgi:hypothetical protein